MKKYLHLFIFTGIAFNSFSQARLILNNGRIVNMPIELTTFNAECDGKVVNIFCQTASELNHHHVEIECCDDGINFTPIAIINYTANNGNAASPVVSVFPSPATDLVTVEINGMPDKLYDKN